MESHADPAWCQGMLTGVEVQGHNLLQPLRSPWRHIYSEDDIHHSDPALFPTDVVFLLYWAHSALTAQFNNNQRLLNPYFMPDTGHLYAVPFKPHRTPCEIGNIVCSTL